MKVTEILEFAQFQIFPAYLEIHIMIHWIINENLLFYFAIVKVIPRVYRTNTSRVVLMGYRSPNKLLRT